MLRRLSLVAALLAFVGLGLAIVSEQSFAGKQPDPSSGIASQGRTTDPITPSTDVVFLDGKDDERGLEPEVLAKIEELRAEKMARTPIEQKFDSNLLHEFKKRKGEARGAVLEMNTGVRVASDETTVVEIRADVTDTLLAQLNGVNAQIKAVVPEYRSVTARVPMDSLENLAALNEVHLIMPQEEATTNRSEEEARPMVVSSSMFSGKDPRGVAMQEKMRRELVKNALSSYGGTRAPFAGSQISEGDATHRSDLARTDYALSGTGIRIGILSDGVDSLAARQASLDLPGVTVLAGQAGTGDEGTAMLEIVHDVAPGAQLYFATAFTSIASFASNIVALRAAGCDIIVDDVSYFVETPFQDGQPGGVSPTNGGAVIQAVNTVTASGALYFSSAGNSGNLNDGTSGVWEGDYVDLAGSSTTHDFGGGQNFTRMVTGGTARRVSLKWSDPLVNSANDYDVYVFHPTTTTLLASSTGVQNGSSDDPSELTAPVSSPSAPGVRVVIDRFSGAGRFLHLNANRGRFSIATNGVVYGHNGSRNSISVAAAPAVGPFPNAYSGTSLSETFTSDGPRRIFYEANGSVITPGNLSSTGGTVLQKPDITAADGVTTTTPGFIPFFGTSASAPHAGAMMALLKQASPASTSTQLYNAMINSALDIELPGVDRDTGHGIFMPIAALTALGINPVPGPFVYNANSNPGVDRYTLRLNGGTYEIVNTVNNNLLASRSAAATNAIDINGENGDDDELTVTYSGGAIPVPVDFDGGLNPGNDTMIVTGYGAVDVDVTHTGPDDGSVAVGSNGTISFNELEPILLGAPPANLVITMPPGANPNSVLDDDGGANDLFNATNDPNRSALRGPTFEYTEFVNPTVSLRVNLGAGGDELRINQMDATFDPSGNPEMRITGGAGQDTIVLRDSEGPTQIDGGGAADEIRLGAPGLTNGLDNLQSTVTVSGDGGNDTLITHDESADFSDTYTITSTSITRDFAGNYVYSTFENVIVNAENLLPTNGNNTFNINSTSSAAAYTINGNNGDDVFNITPVGQFLDPIDGAITVNGGAGTDSLVLHDQGNSFTGDIFTITNSNITRSLFAGVTYGTIESATVHGGSEGHTFNITSSLATTPITVNANGLDDAVNIGAGTLDTILGALTVHGNTGTDTLLINDSADTDPNTYTVSGTVVNRSGAANITHSTFEVLTVNSGSGADTFNATPVANPGPFNMTLNAGAPTPAFGDVINVNTAGVTAPLLSLNNAGTGTFTSTSHQTINLTGFEKRPTITTVVSSPNPSTFGQSVTFTATVVGNPAGPVPTGSVSFFDGGTCGAPGTAIGGATALNGSGQASVSTTALTAGSHTVIACYTATNQFADSSGSVVHVVNKSFTTTTITSDNPDPSVFGQNYAVAVTVAAVAPGSGTPGGSVAVTDGTNNCNITLVGGSGSCNLPSTSAGPKTLTATYAETSNFFGSSDTEAHTVNKAATATVVTKSPVGNTTYGDAVTFTAVVTTQAPGAGTPVGTVNFFDATGPIPGCQTLASVSNTASSRTYTCTTSILNAGAQTITAFFSGSDNFEASNGSINHTVNKKQVTVRADNKSRNYGQANPAFTWFINNSDFVLGQTLATSGITGTPTMTTTATPSSPVGTYPITITQGSMQSANYSFAFADGTLTVNKATLTFTADNKTRVFGAPDPAFTWTVSGFVNGEVLANSGVTGSPSLSTTATSTSNVGTYPINVSVAGMTSANYNLVGAAGQLTITAAGTTTVITNAASLNLNPTQVGQSYAVNVTVSPIAPSTGVPNGTVLVSDGNGQTCNITLASGSGSCNLTATDPGQKTLTATYTPAGSPANFTGSSTTAGVPHLVVIGVSGNVKQYIAFGTNTNLAGVTMTLSGSANATTTTDANGNYSFGVVTTNGNFTVTPSGLGKQYEAIKRTYSGVTNNITGGNFIAYDVPGPNALPRTARMNNQIATAGQGVTMPVLMTTTGAETKVSFSVNTNVAMVGVPTVSCGSGAPGCSLSVDTSLPGKLGITMTPVGALSAGTREIVRISYPTFATATGTMPVQFGDFPTTRDVRNSENNPLPTLYWTDGQLAFSGGTIVEGPSISGRVTTAGGQGLRNATVILTDAAGGRQSTLTSSFGNYSFTNLQQGATYSISIVSRRYRFSARVVNLAGDNLTNIDFVGLE